MTKNDIKEYRERTAEAIERDAQMLQRAGDRLRSGFVFQSAQMIQSVLSNSANNLVDLGRIYEAEQK